MNQEQAAECMNVSRPTLTRIYEAARKAIAKAFVEGKAIDNIKSFVGGFLKDGGETCSSHDHEHKCSNAEDILEK